MGLFGRRGRRHPDAGTPTYAPDHVYASLLALDGTDLPFAVRPGERDGADLIAEARRTKRVGSDVTEYTLLVLMRLVPADREVRALDKQWTVSRGVLGLPSWEYGSGNVSWTEWNWTLGRGPDGRWRFHRGERVSTEQIKNPLRETVLRCGWSWCPVSSGRL